MKVFQNDTFKKYSYFLLGCLLSVVGFWVAIDGGGLPLLQRFTILLIALAGTLQVISTFYKKLWKKTIKYIQVAFFVAGFFTLLKLAINQVSTSL